MESRETHKRKSAAYRKVRRRNITMGFFAFLILVGICLFTPVFDISGISVTGNKILSSEDVIKASGIKIGDSFIFLNKDKGEKAINALGYVDKVDIKRKFFTRIEIAVTEVSESAYVTFSGNYVGIDIDGKVLSVKKSSKINPKRAVVTGLKVKSVKKGETITFANNEKCEVVMEILKFLENKKILPHTTKIDVTDLNNVFIVLDTETRIIFGKCKDLEYKIEYAKVILEKQPNAHGGSIDLTNTESVIYDPDDSEYIEKEKRKEEAQKAKEAKEAKKAKKAKKDSKSKEDKKDDNNKDKSSKVEKNQKSDETAKKDVNTKSNKSKKTTKADKTTKTEKAKSAKSAKKK